MSRAIRTGRTERRSGACRGRRSAPTERGFTLLEVLVALAIFAAASLIAYSGLNAVVSIKGSLDREMRFWRELGQVFDRLDVDLLQIVPHALRDEQGGGLAPLLGSSADNDAAFRIELSRFDEDRTPIHASYRCDDGRISLRLEMINGRSAGAPTAPVHVLLQDVEHCAVAFLGANNAWSSAWPGSETSVKPRAVRIRLVLAGRGQFERLYYLP